MKKLKALAVNKQSSKEVSLALLMWCDRRTMSHWSFRFVSLTPESHCVASIFLGWNHCPLRSSNKGTMHHLQIVF